MSQESVPEFYPIAKRTLI